VVFASRDRVAVEAPDGLPGGQAAIAMSWLSGVTAFIESGEPLATGVHQVDNPVFDRSGNLFVTYSGSRGQDAAVSIFRVPPGGAREPFVSGIVNATSMAIGPDDRLYVSSRFDGTVSRVLEDGRHEVIASDLGRACGLAFAPDGTLFVGDRSGTIFHIDAKGSTTAFATLPASVAAFHLAFGPDHCLYVTAPTLASSDRVYRMSSSGQVEALAAAFGRPQGLAFDADGVLHVVEALAGASGVYRFPADGQPELIVSGRGLVGLAFSPDRRLVVSSNDTVYAF
jgi:sugar lactone lactonase YvrE